MGAKVFISWSGERSKQLALALREWIPTVVDKVDPFVSDIDIEKGTKGLDKLDKELESTKHGILCLTPENLRAPWINYEAGSLAKFTETRRIWTVLFNVSVSDVQKANVPYAQFQHTQVEDEKDVVKLLASIYQAAEHDTSANTIKTRVHRGWPDLQEKLKAISTEAIVSTKPTPEQMIVDLHQHLRSTKSLGMVVTSPTTPVSSGRFSVSGTYRESPPAGQAIIPIVQCGRDFRPNEPIRDFTDGKWKSKELWFSGVGRNTIHIVRPDDQGKALIDFYAQVARFIKQDFKKADHYIPILMDRLPHGMPVETVVAIDHLG